MWEFLIKTFRPTNILEIGVYRGQTLSLFTLISKMNKINSEVWGITPLDHTGDSVSKYLDLDYKEDIIKNFKKFDLETVNLVKSLSNEVKAKNFIESKVWDLIYIDGNHEYEVVKSDFELCFENLNENGIIVIDDSSLYQNFNFENINIPTFNGHPGPSKVVKEILENNKMKFLFGVGHNNVFIK